MQNNVTRLNGHGGACAPSARRKGAQPACIEACPVQASISRYRDEILEEAQRRILNDAKYVKYIYGRGKRLVELQSSISPTSPSKSWGLLPRPNSRCPTLTVNALGDVPTIVLVGGAMLSGLYGITQPRAQVALAETQEKSIRPGPPNDTERSE
jgi:formate dehydrogenase iron-sulfur subunit